MPRYELDGKVALVTGGARGIGFATARALLARGASVLIGDLDAGAAAAGRPHVVAAAGALGAGGPWVVLGAGEAGGAARPPAQLHDSRAVGIAGDVTDRSAM